LIHLASQNRDIRSFTIMATSSSSADAEPATAGFQPHHRRGLLASGVILLITLALMPIAGQQWPRIPAFLPAYQTAIIAAYAIAAYLIYTLYRETKAVSLLYLWGGCSYTAAILVAQFLSFQSAFVQDAALIGSKQTTIWLWCFWHFGPSVMLCLYARSEWRRPGLLAGDTAGSFRRAAWMTSVAVLMTIAAVTVFHDYLPVLDVGGDFRRINSTGIAPAIQVAIIAAIFMLWRATRFRSSLDTWLGVALLALLLDNTITMLGGTRLSVGWYVGRINALISAIVMLAIYLKVINSGYLAFVDNAKKLEAYQENLKKLVSERTQALDDTRATLLHSQKLEAVGKLTGGVAHDFNNVLQIINGNLELIKRFSHDNEQILDRLGSARMAVERGARLSSQLLAFARKQPLQPTTVNLCEIVLGMDLLLKRAVGEGIEIENIHCDDAWHTFADPHQLENVILNLALNARDAISGQGKLTLDISNTILTEAELAYVQDVAPGEYVLLAVRDTGSGMTPEVMERAFEPFFTTKEVGKGTGLGLSMTYGFVKQSGGHIEIDSEPGVGTTVRVYLPRSFANEDAKTRNIQPENRIVGGTETILVVEGRSCGTASGR
jgi:signal transduction histidine kinase